MSRFLRRVERDAYLICRTAGDLNAADRGPEVLAKRLARRQLTRTAFSVLRAISRGTR